MFLRTVYYEENKLKLNKIFILNLMDIGFTIVLLTTGYFKEGNVLLGNLVNNPLLFILIKGGMVYLLIKIIIHRMREGSEKTLFYSKIIINLCIALYIFINMTHITWIWLFLIS